MPLSRHEGIRSSAQPCCEDTPACKPTFCQENKPGREDHPSRNGVTLTWPGNKELELNGISESISFPLLTVTVPLTQAGQRGWRQRKRLAVGQLSDQC